MKITINKAATHNTHKNRRFSHMKYALKNFQFTKCSFEKNELTRQFQQEKNKIDSVESLIWFVLLLFRSIFGLYLENGSAFFFLRCSVNSNCFFMDLICYNIISCIGFVIHAPVPVLGFFFSSFLVGHQTSSTVLSLSENLIIFCFFNELAANATRDALQLIRFNRSKHYRFSVLHEIPFPFFFVDGYFLEPFRK